MRPRVLAWVVAAVFLPLLGAESAFATDPPGGNQAISQCACSQQSADASSASTQTKPTNQNISVDVLSPGNTTGPVTQINSSAAASAAGNKNTTDQTASQDPPSGGSTQAIGQQAGNDQSASATSTSTQDHPTNQNISVHVLSPGSNTGPVTQVNSSAALAAAGNSNDTSQTANQTAGGGAGQQVIDQSAKNDQTADATATSTQDPPKNQNNQADA